jgi:hypothetical protein
MRRSIVFVSALVLMLAFGTLSIARQYPPNNNPQYRPGNPQSQRVDPMRGDRRSILGPLSADLARQAEYLSQTSYNYFMGWNGSINDQEQAILFKTEEFASSCRLFNKLVQDQTGYFRRESLRTNLYSASRYVESNFRQLEMQMQRGGMRNDFGGMRRDGRRYDPQMDRGNNPQMNRGNMNPSGMAECRRLLNRIEAEFTSWR